MSVVIAVKLPSERIYVAADSRCCFDVEYLTLNKDYHKLSQREDGLIIGGAGIASDVLAIRYDKNFIPTADLDKLDMSYMVNLHPYIINKLMDYHGYSGAGISIPRIDAGFAPTSYIIAYGGHAWELDSSGFVLHIGPNEDDSISKVGDSLIIGCGAPYLRAVINKECKNWKTDEEAIECINNAIKTSSELTWAVDDKIVSFISEPLFRVCMSLTQLEEQTALIYSKNETPSKGLSDCAKVSRSKSRRS